MNEHYGERLGIWGCGHCRCPGCQDAGSGLPGGGGVGLGLDSVECPEPHPSFLLSLHLPALLGFGSTAQRSAYQTIDSPEAPTDLYAGAENKGHTPQGY